MSIVGLSTVEGFYEVWNFDIDEMRSYKFEKTVRATHLASGETFDTKEWEFGLREAVIQAPDSANRRGAA
ncbi:hypothetical protein WG899_11450 [Paucibacter sp. AS339]|uniref:hypothetical protein n=1 Tax=Paucibacter hankyongi TaxID=3133434 RepID=UPI0030AC8A80